MPKSTYVPLLAALFVTAASPASAQTSTTGSIEGTVTDSTDSWGVCPRGVIVRTNNCRPPGKVKQQFQIGQRIPIEQRIYTPLADIPPEIRNQIPPVYRTRDYRFIYNNGIVYLVNARGSKIGGAVAGVLYATFHNND